MATEGREKSRRSREMIPTKVEVEAAGLSLRSPRSRAFAVLIFLRVPLDREWRRGVAFRVSIL